MRRWMTGTLAGLVACGSPAADRAPDASRDTVSEAPTSALASSLAVSIAGDSVRLRLDLTNATDEALVLEFGTAQRYDFVISNAAGAEVWRWSSQRGFAQALTSDTLAPGAARSYEEAWPALAEPGVYVAEARLTSLSHPVDLRTEFELPAR